MPNTRLFIGYSSALYFWLRGSRGLWPAEPCRITSIARCAYNANDVQSFLLPRDAFGPAPLHIMVDAAAKRRNTPFQTSHVWAGTFPERCFVPIGHDVFVAAPALCYLQAAASLPFFDLAELGFELCGGYSRTPGIGKGFIQRDFTLATPSIMKALVDKLSYSDGSKRAAAVLDYVMPNSKSPAETDMAVKTVFPRLRGGYGFPLAELNPEIPLTDEAAAIAHRPVVYPDELWRKEKVSLEYDSTLHHERAEDRTRDSLKRNALACMGYNVITVTPSQLKSVSEFHGIAIELARHLGIRMRPVTPKIQQKRFELNEAIRERMSKDTTPTEWPYC